MTKGAFQDNWRSVQWWLAVGLAVGLLMVVWPGRIQANGGATLWVEKIGAYELTVTASPFPLQVGVNDISVLLGRRSDSQLILDAEVMMIAKTVDQPGRSQTFPATHANATNKLYYAANVDFPTPGRWELTVRVNGPDGAVSTSFETQVEPASSFSFLRYLISLTGLSLIGITLLFFVLSRRTGKDFNNDEKQEVNNFDK